jgi:hypothetical protein
MDGVSYSLVSESRTFCHAAAFFCYETLLQVRGSGGDDYLVVVVVLDG